MMHNDPIKYGWNAENNWYWPNCGEINILGEVGYDQNSIHVLVQSKAAYFKVGNQKTGHPYIGDATSADHVYDLEWFDDDMDFFVDNIKYFTVNNDGWGWCPFNYDFRVILNLAVGGDWGGAQGVNPNIWPW